MPEYCDGAGSCSPADAFKPSEGTKCGDGTDTICDNPDTCNAAGQCANDNNEPTGDAVPRGQRHGLRHAGVLRRRRQLSPPRMPSSPPRARSAATGPTRSATTPTRATPLGSAPTTTTSRQATLCHADNGTGCDMPEYCDGAGSCPPRGCLQALRGHEVRRRDRHDLRQPRHVQRRWAVRQRQQRADRRRRATRTTARAATCRSTATAQAAVPPADAFKPSEGTKCGDGTDTICDNPDTCNAAGQCANDNNEPTGDAVPRGQRHGLRHAGVLRRRRQLSPPRMPSSPPRARSAATGPTRSATTPTRATPLGSAPTTTTSRQATLCHADNGTGCDMPEYCDGAGSCPPRGCLQALRGHEVRRRDRHDLRQPRHVQRRWAVRQRQQRADRRRCATRTTARAATCRSTATAPRGCSCPTDAFKLRARSAATGPTRSATTPTRATPLGSAPTTTTSRQATLCHADNGTGCDMPEYCDGAGSCLPRGCLQALRGHEVRRRDLRLIATTPTRATPLGSAPTTTTSRQATLCHADNGTGCDMPEYCDGAGSCPPRMPSSPPRARSAATGPTPCATTPTPAMPSASARTTTTKGRRYAVP